MRKTLFLLSITSLVFATDTASEIVSGVVNDSVNSIPDVINAYNNGGWVAAAIVVACLLAGAAFKIWISPYLAKKSKVLDSEAEKIKIEANATNQQRINFLIDVRLIPFMSDTLRHILVTTLPLELIKISSLVAKNDFKSYDWKLVLTNIRIKLKTCTRDKFPIEEFGDITDKILDDLIERLFTKFKIPGQEIIESVIINQGTDKGVSFLTNKFNEFLNKN